MNFLVWRQGLRGPVPSIDLFDPRQSGDWKTNQQTTIQIIPLKDHERSMSLDTLIVLHPCKETA
jgi:hypothetical protein